jgi:hypothetical protein
MLQRNVEASCMGMGIDAMEVQGVGVVVVGSLLPATWKQFSFQLLNFDPFKVKQR